jgi:hypothetical protein
MLIATFDALHLLCAVFWFGSFLYTEIVLWPKLREAGMLATVQGTLRNVSSRRLSAIFVVATIVTGYVLGILLGAADRLQSPLGMMFVLAAFAGFPMLVWWLSFPSRDRKMGWCLYYSGVSGHLRGDDRPAHDRRLVSGARRLALPERGLVRS